MKKFLLLTIFLCCFALNACGDKKTSKNETQTINAEIQYGEQYEKRPIRMFNVDGDLYYDSGLVSDMTSRCGNLDGKLKKTVSDNEIPIKTGDSNFEAEGYQHATSITKEVNIDGEWIIFKKYKHLPDKLLDYRYCFYIKGQMNNAAVNSEMVVLTDNTDVTFDDVIAPMLSHVKADEKNYRISHENIVSGDKWGLSLYAENVTKTGMTIKFEQFGGNPTGELQTGEWYKLETTVNDEWQEVKTKSENTFWNSIAYNISKNDITDIHVNWEYLYGELSTGFYRLSKRVMDFRSTGDYDEEIYQVHFTVE